jgi:hypothetical protein
VVAAGGKIHAEILLRPLVNHHSGHASRSQSPPRTSARALSVTLKSLACELVTSAAGTHDFLSCRRRSGVNYSPGPLPSPPPLLRQADRQATGGRL